MHVQNKQTDHFQDETHSHGLAFFLLDSSTSLSRRPGPGQYHPTVANLVQGSTGASGSSFLPQHPLLEDRTPLNSPTFPMPLGHN